ncbi:MAG: hypothetical protein WDM70_03790 [Nitrosomonadales bacterium]
MPQNDYAKIAELKQVCQKAGLQVKKSELLRAGLHALSNLSAAKLKQTIVKNGANQDRATEEKLMRIAKQVWLQLAFPALKSDVDHAILVNEIRARRCQH